MGKIKGLTSIMRPRSSLQRDPPLSSCRGVVALTVLVALMIVVPRFARAESASSASSRASSASPKKTGPTRGKVVIGAILPLTGWASETGKAERDGILLAEEQIKRRGGIRASKGHQALDVSVMVIDNESSEEKTKVAFHTLASKHEIKAIIGPGRTEFCTVIAPLAEKYRIPVICTTGYPIAALDSASYLFTLGSPPEAHVQPLSRYFEDQRYSSIAIFVTDTPHYVSLAEALRDHSYEPLREHVTIIKFPRRVSDFRPALANLNKRTLDALVIFLAENDSLGTFLRQAQQLPIGLPIFGESGLARDLEIRGRMDLAEGIIFSDERAQTTEEFFLKFQDMFEREPGLTAGIGYDATMSMTKGLERCNSSNNLVLSECLRQVKFVGATGKIDLSKSLPGESHQEFVLSRFSERSIVRMPIREQKPNSKKEKPKK